MLRNLGGSGPLSNPHKHPSDGWTFLGKVFSQTNQNKARITQTKRISPGSNSWVAQKLTLAGHDIANMPGQTLKLAKDFGQGVIHPLRTGKDDAFRQDVKGIAKGTVDTIRHPLRDPFATGMFVVPFGKGLLRTTGKGVRFLEPINGFEAPAHLARNGKLNFSVYGEDNPAHEIHFGDMPKSAFQDILHRARAHNHNAADGEALAQLLAEYLNNPYNRN